MPVYNQETANKVSPQVRKKIDPKNSTLCIKSCTEVSHFIRIVWSRRHIRNCFKIELYFRKDLDLDPVCLLADYT